MNNFKKYLVWATVWVLSIWTVSYAAWNGTIWDLFVNWWTQWFLVWDNIQDNTIDNTEIENNATYEVGKLWIWTSSPSKKLHIVWNGTWVDSRMFVIENSNTSDSNANANMILKWNWWTRWGIRFHWSNRGIDDKFNHDITYNFNEKKLYFIDWEDWVNKTRMVIQSDWKVWIWTTSPDELLEVNWNVLANQYLQNSDARLKKDITRLDNSLDKILSLNWYSYVFKSTWTHDIWLIAQELEKVYPELVHTWKDWYKSVQYQNLVAPLIEAIKTQQTQIDKLQEEIEELKNK